jgi:hypothetical protein
MTLVDFDKYLIESKVPFLTTELSESFRLVGSRGVLPVGELKPDTDYDFIGINNPANVAYLYSLGFKEHGKTHEHYFDVSTEAIFYFSRDGLVNESDIQVVLKKPSYWNVVNKFWDILQKNPNMYRKSFWKSNPDLDPCIPREQRMSEINNKINVMLDDVVPFI